MDSYIVIGAGSAGCVLARRLLDAGHRVTVLEAGGEDTNPIIANVHEAGGLWHGPEDWDYYTVEQPGCSNRSIHLPRGKVLGGSHALNATIWVRGAKQDYDTWNYLGCPGWGWEDVLPVFRAIENYDGGASESRGTGGPLDVVADFPMNPVQESILAGAAEMGIMINADYNSGDVEGASRMQLNIRGGKRFNTWQAYLRPVMDNPNLTLLTGATVRQLLIENGAVAGVEFLQDGAVQTLRADETLLAGGAVGSPRCCCARGLARPGSCARPASSRCWTCPVSGRTCTTICSPRSFSPPLPSRCRHRRSVRRKRTCSGSPIRTWRCRTPSPFISRCPCISWTP
nr:GMC family oxidoreductase [Arthrobacter sp. ATA002]